MPMDEREQLLESIDVSARAAASLGHGFYEPLIGAMPTTGWQPS